MVREYIGRGQVAELAAQLDGLEREERRLALIDLQSERELLRELEGYPEDLYETIDALAMLALVRAGYHRHNRGEWRRRRA